MELKHFSHHHPLLPHQLHQPSQLHCSGCKSPASGNLYACRKCNYFLHDQCVRASRSLVHPSHPLHPLTLVPYPTHPSTSFFCNSCNLTGHGFSYTCSHCDFDLHLHCALNPNPNPNHNHNPNPQNFHNPPQNPTNPNPNPQTFHNPPQNPKNPNHTQNHNPPPPPPPQHNHFSHPHPLKEVELDDDVPTKPCSACEHKLSGTTYSCAGPHNCSFSLHKACFDAPREVRHRSHRRHPLTLLPAAPYAGGSFTCDACQRGGRGFAYTCGPCGYDLHIDCVRWPEMLSRPDHRHALVLYHESPFPAAGGAVFYCDVCGGDVDEKAWVYYCRECDFGTHLECGSSEVKAEDLYLKLQEMKLQARIDDEVRESMLDLWDDRKKKYRYTYI